MTTSVRTSTPTVKQPVSSSPYRFDLDGLRGFSIMLVVVFHVFVGRVSGGVDVFLLLSGYFFMGTQLRYAMRPNPSLNPWWPFWRTARRLLPALAVVLAAVYAGIRYLTPQVMSQEIARQFKASVLYYQNYELSSQDAAYAAAGSQTSPLQHLWSMSVQGQFYLFAITSGILVAILVTRAHVGVQRLRRWIVVILALITIASFAYASRFGFVGTPANYYALPSRLWELSFGALLAMLPSKVAIPARFQAPAAGLGVTMIAATGFIIPTSLAFPGPAALIPLLGAALVVLSGPQHVVAKLLSSSPMTWLGKVAYSLYLWHWPLLILLTVYTGKDEPSVLLGIGVIAASLALAHITYKLVEDPLRQHGKRPKATDQPVRNALASLSTFPGRARAIGGVAIAVLLAGTLAILPMFNKQVEQASGELDPALYPGAMAHFGADVPRALAAPDPHFISDMWPPTVDRGCMIFMDQPGDLLPHEGCVFGDPDSDVTVVLFGGSHAEPWVVPLDKIGRERGFKVITYVRQECPLVLDDLDTVSEVCAEWSRNAFAEIIALQPDLAISNATRPAGRAGSGGIGPDIVPDAYATVWDKLRLNGIPFVGLRDNPWVFSREGDHMDPNECLLARNTMNDCSTLRSTVYAPTNPAEQYLFAADKQWTVDTADWFCEETYCPPIIGNIYVYRDQNHISNAYAESTAPIMWQSLQPIFDALDLPYRNEEVLEDLQIIES
ncbi:acyltransferase family protein [Corynebacterium sp. MSK044]|uniref:acyltransferase family protein n=1 Tax=Corynebacterium sp. MSK044 TaxID=3050195 RepID=UPI00254E82EE|nr:acyltransferase family protein [Corynebacterium sp. MSK044]MDK8796293.1 acyltransferase family protein [Corynebacterium sp. MSK044]